MRVSVRGVEFERVGTGEWVYAETGIEVPGARDLTLSDRFEPLLAGRPGAGPEQALVSAEHVRENPDLLGWCREIGALVRDPTTGKAAGYMVPYEAWLEHDREPIGVTAAEFSEDDAEAQLALAEHEYRAAQRRSERASARRLAALKTAIASGVSRTRAAEITGLSNGRVTQLLHPSDARVRIEQSILTALSGGALSALNLRRRLAVPPAPRPPVATVDSALLDLRQRGLVKESPDDVWQLTPSGREYARDHAVAAGSASDLRLVEGGAA